jgi:hypothetical protein
MRGKTDSEVVQAMIAVTDARFQDQLVQQAKAAGKLDVGYRIPETARRNTPGNLAGALQPFRARGLFDSLPFGSDFTADELDLAAALKFLQSQTSTTYGRAVAIAKAFLSEPASARIDACLKRMALQKPARTLQEWLTRRLLSHALHATLPTGNSGDN